MRRTVERRMRLLRLLQRGHMHRTGDLASELGVDERTIRRDVAWLANLGVRVDAVRGWAGGLRSVRSSRTPPIVLSDDELAAVVIALVRSMQAGLLTEWSDTADTLLRTLERLMPDHLHQRVRHQIPTVDHAAPAGPVLPQPESALLALSLAIRTGQPAVIGYRDTDGPSQRVIRPTGIVLDGSTWFVVADDSATDVVRSFAVPRIDRCVLVDGWTNGVTNDTPVGSTDDTPVGSTSDPPAGSDDGPAEGAALGPTGGPSVQVGTPRPSSV